MSGQTSLSAHFDALFDADSDPWGTRTRWYERRKRALALAMLPRERYRRAFEPGCGAGELTRALVGRCDDLLATDASAAAAAHARARLAGTSAKVWQGRVPDDWPEGRFDLIVVGELGYYLEASSLDRLAQACQRSLGDEGTLLACHWRRGARDMLRSAADVHAVLGGLSGRPRVCRYEDDDVLIEVWSGDTRSVAQREGLA